MKILTAALIVLFLMLADLVDAQTLVPPFPNSPTTNQEVIGPDGQVYRWDGSKWVHGGATAGPWAPETNPAGGVNNYAPINNAALTGTLTLNGTALTGLFAPLVNPTNGQNNYLPIAGPTYTGLLTGPRALLTDSNAAVLFNSATTPRATLVAPGRAIETAGIPATLEIAAGAHYSGTGSTWVADTANPSIIEATDTNIAFFLNRGATVGNNFTPSVYARMSRSTSTGSGGLYLWDFNTNRVGPLVQVQNHADAPNNKAAAAGFDAITVDSTTLPGQQHNFWILNRSKGFTGIYDSDIADSGLIQTEGTGGLVIQTFNGAELLLKSGVEQLGAVGSIWMGAGNAGGVGISPSSLWVGFPPTWTTSLLLQDGRASVNHLDNDQTYGVPVVDQGAVLASGSRDTFGRVTAGTWTFNLWFARAFVGTPTCVLTPFGTPRVWFISYNAADAIGISCYENAGGPVCANGQQVVYHCASTGG